MSNTLKVGITGGIGTGKSTVCRIFESLKIPIYDADSRAKYLMTHDPILQEEIKENFGNQSFLPDNTPNRTFLAQTVFSNPEKLAKLNSLVHPAVKRDTERWANNYIQKVPYILKEAALLFESASYKDLDKIIVVTAPLELRIERVLQRDSHRNRADIEAIISKQWKEEDKISLADFVILNDFSKSLIEQVLEIHQEILKLHN